MDEIRIGLDVGVDGFEHTGLGTAPGYPEDILQQLRQRNSALYWTPTVSPLYTLYETGTLFPERLDSPAWRDGMPRDMADEVRQSLSAIPHLPYYALFPSRIPILPHKFRQLRETGVRMMIGTGRIPSMFTRRHVARCRSSGSWACRRWRFCVSDCGRPVPRAEDRLGSSRQAIRRHHPGAGRSADRHVRMRRAGGDPGVGSPLGRRRSRSCRPLGSA
jgi:hypothetical protein